jgi:uncharacterized membrane protein SirB2
MGAEFCGRFSAKQKKSRWVHNKMDLILVYGICIVIFFIFHQEHRNQNLAAGGLFL